MASTLPAGWIAKESSSRPGKLYYINTATGETQWHVPTTPVASSIAATAGPAHAGTVRASHILVKHAGSRRPSSWRQATITCSKEEAVAKLTALRDAIVSGRERFEDVARRESDCSSASRGGDLGEFGPGQMQAPFEHATYALKVGELSSIVETDSGVHIILRTK